MASTCNNAEYRESAVYVQPEIEGYLDKKSTGVFRTKTPRRWCWVQGSIFYQQKSNPGSGPGEIEVFDISGAQCVRKVSTDLTETQFEIVLKKTYVFICGSREECNSWLKALQTAITIKSSSQSIPGGSRFYTSSPEQEAGTYYSIDESLNSNKPPSTSKNESLSPRLGSVNDSTYNVYNEYIEPKDALCNGETGRESAEENIYSDVQEVEGCIASNSSNHDSNSSLSTDRPTPPPRSATSPKADVSAVNDDSCRVSPSQSASICGSSEVYSDGCSAESKQSLGMKNYQDEMVQSQPSNTSFTQAVSDMEEITTQTADVTDQEDPVNFLFEALDERMSPVSDLEYTLTQDDANPVKELKAFLRKNDILCRVSTDRLSQSQDPVTACRSYLVSLDQMM